MIFAGTGVDRAQANAALIGLVEVLACPVIPSMAGRSVVPHDHPSYFHSQSPAADDLRRNADVMLVVGSRVGNLDVPFDKYWGDPAKCRVIHIDVDPRHIGVSRPVTLGIVADARTALEGLTASCGAASLRASDAPMSLRCGLATKPGPRRLATRSRRGPAPVSIRPRRSGPSVPCSAVTRCTASTAA